jgi:phosphoribosyl 1,2-cyclic phosphodiesterase
VRVQFLGVRGSTPAPGAAFIRYGGHTSCVALSHGTDAPTLLLDAGTGIRRASALLGGQPFRGAIVLSHLHWDHVHGLPFFEAADRDDAYTTVYLPDQEDGSAAVEVLARGMSPPHFPVRPDGLRGTWSFVALAPSTVEMEGFTVTVAEIPHKGGRTYGVRVSDDTSTIAYLPDHCPSDAGPGNDGWGEYHESAMALARDADVLIHDAQFTAAELVAKSYLGHAAVEYAVALGRAAGVQRVVLFHHQPDRSDDALDALAGTFSAPPLVSVASESLVLDLP